MARGTLPRAALAATAVAATVVATVVAVVVVVAVATALIGARPATAHAATAAPQAAAVTVGAATDAPNRPPVTANEFLPEERNLSDCVGALERPGCGSEARGGWRQTLVFLAVAAGLVLVFGRIAWSARRSRQRA